MPIYQTFWYLIGAGPHTGNTQFTRNYLPASAPLRAVTALVVADADGAAGRYKVRASFNTISIIHSNATPGVTTLGYPAKGGNPLPPWVTTGVEAQRG